MSDRDHQGKGESRLSISVNFQRLLTSEREVMGMVFFRPRIESAHHKMSWILRLSKYTLIVSKAESFLLYPINAALRFPATSGRSKRNFWWAPSCGRRSRVAKRRRRAFSTRCAANCASANRWPKSRCKSSWPRSHSTKSSSFLAKAGIEKFWKQFFTTNLLRRI